MNLEQAIATWPIQGPDEDIWDFIRRKGRWRSPLEVSLTAMALSDVTQQMVADSIGLRASTIERVVQGWSHDIEQNLIVGDAVVAAIEERWRSMPMARSTAVALGELKAAVAAVRALRDRIEGEKIGVQNYFGAIFGKPGRFELVDGVLVELPKANQSHAVVRSNILAALVPAGKAKGYRTTSSGTAVLTGPYSLRTPDVVVDAADPDQYSWTADQPVVIVDVGSRSCPHQRRAEYQSMPSLLLIIEARVVPRSVTAYYRAPSGSWARWSATDYDAEVEIPILNMSLPLATIFDTIGEDD